LFSQCSLLFSDLLRNHLLLHPLLQNIAIRLLTSR
jgi:hypothetical protein